MESKKWLLQMDGIIQKQALQKTNEFTKQFGLTLSEGDMELLLEDRRQSLREQERVEFREGILPRLIFAFCDSPYIYQDNYTETIARLQEIFYLYKNETLDELTDDELIDLMKREFEGSCQGSLDYLEETCMERLARRIRYGEALDMEGGGND